MASLTIPPNAYRVRDWNRHFENNRTRELKRMDWVPVPNKHDGAGFCQLMDHQNGLSHYGAWHLILQVASKCDPRGILVREGAERRLVALTCADIARMSHSNKELVEEAMKRLVTIGWIDVYSNPAQSCDNLAERCGEVTMEWNGMEVRTHAGEEQCLAHTRELIREQVGAMFGRKPDDPLTHLEEEALVSVSRRPSSPVEVLTIQEYREEMAKAGRLKYFPRSFESLLSKWSSTLDAAMTFEPGEAARAGGVGRGNGAPVWKQIKALEDEISKHPANSSSVFHDKNATDLQRNDLRMKKSKLKELQGVSNA